MSQDQSIQTVLGRRLVGVVALLLRSHRATAGVRGSWLAALTSSDQRSAACATGRLGAGRHHWAVQAGRRLPAVEGPAAKREQPAGAGLLLLLPQPLLVCAAAAGAATGC